MDEAQMIAGAGVPQLTNAERIVTATLQNKAVPPKHTFPFIDDPFHFPVLGTTDKMSGRKLQQEIDKTFKKVDEGIDEFNSIYEKIYSSQNASQKDKLEEHLKREIKKLQKHRDQIKSWAAGNDIKDKSGLMEQRKRIEKCMESFKAVEKEMKTKAFSKEGLSQNQKLDPKEKEREELCDFLTEQLEEIERFLVEELEPEANALQAGMKKKQKDNQKAERLAEIETITERLRWHESKLQLLLRSLQNANVDNQVVLDIKSDIEEVVRDGREADFEGEAYEGIYDDCNLDSEEAMFGLANENENVSSQDAQSLVDETPEPEPAQAPIKKPKPEPPTVVRRPSTQLNTLKSPLPALATLNTMPPPPPMPKDTTMKPAPPPATSGLKYSSAAAAANANDKNGVGIAPLPPPPGLSAGQPSPAPTRASIATSPGSVNAQPVDKIQSPAPASVVESSSPANTQSKSPTLSSTSLPAASQPNSVPATPAMDKTEAIAEPVIADQLGTTNGESQEEVESIYHLPPGLQDLLDSFEVTKTRATQNPAQLARLLEASHANCPEPADMDRPQNYRPSYKYATPAHYPQDILPIFDDPALYENQRMETDTLFYIFYYKQGTYQQYLAAKALKNQSWRFHKQYQTWFQRHEEPKQITEEYEQGTYRFFDYESTWMNRRKADFKFVYKFLEDDL